MAIHILTGSDRFERRRYWSMSNMSKWVELREGWAGGMSVGRAMYLTLQFRGDYEG